MVRASQLLLVLLTLAAPAAACPFCTSVAPSLSQRRDEATVAALAEVSQSGADSVTFRLHKLLTGAEHVAHRETLTLSRSDATGAAAIKVGQLALLLGTRAAAADKLAWDVVPLNEVGYAYIARAPSRRLPSAERLAHYVKFLEHADPLLAEDAYLEFGAASYDEVAQLADRLPFASIRRWIADDKVPEARKGFYGLALGLARSPADRAANRDALRRVIDGKADDFRAGFDGILGGYLMLEGRQGLKLIEERFLAAADARPGDVQHAVTALRFMHEFGRDAIPAADLNRAMRRLLARPEFAATAIVDLARIRDWAALDDVVALFGREGYPEPATTGAIVGYLLACPRKEAADALAQLRKRDPRRVAEAEARRTVFGPNR
ncbi:MAG: hypothetical protein HYX69_05355 [Planctomycetia bacterium]|nr:hypothetical protein [Planctomycetia bacterium]